MQLFLQIVAFSLQTVNGCGQTVLTKGNGPKSQLSGMLKSNSVGLLDKSSSRRCMLPICSHLMSIKTYLITRWAHSTNNPCCDVFNIWGEKVF